MITDREKQVLNLLAKGKRRFEILEILGISKLTLDRIIYGLKQSMKAENTVNLIHIATKQHII